MLIRRRGGDIKSLVKKIRELEALQKDRKISIDILTENSEYWPIWWYFRANNNIHYYAIKPAQYRFADVVVATPSFANHFVEKHFTNLANPRVPIGYYRIYENMEIRPGVFVDVLVTHKIKNLLDARDFEEIK